MRRAALLALGLSLSGCAALMNGTRQDVAVATDPPDAFCRIPGQSDFKTPALVPLKRPRGYAISCELPGYRPAQAALAPKLSRWLWGDILCLPPLGLMVDFTGGAAYTLVPEKVRLSLQPKRPEGAEPSKAYTEMLGQFTARRDDAVRYHSELTRPQRQQLTDYLLSSKGKDSAFAPGFIVDASLPAAEQAFVSWYLETFTPRRPVKPGPSDRPFTGWMKP